jgi:hypothetical protein
MTTLDISIETTQLERLADRLDRLDIRSIGETNVRAVNAVAKRGFDESVRRMTSRVNLTEQYVRDRMTVEPANDPRKPEATIIAFRAGGRKPGMRATNLRQYGVVQLTVPTRFTNDNPKIVKRAMGANPRKPGGFLPWKKRVGDPQAGIPLGQKAAGLSVEVVRGDRKIITIAFMRRMPNGETLVMARKKGERGAGKGKGKIEALHSLSVWQLFRSTIPEVVPLILNDLEETVAEELDTTIRKEVFA